MLMVWQALGGMLCIALAALAAIDDSPKQPRPAPLAATAP
jgi:hypothetical protein